jgi:hypothetical protein
MQIVNVFPLYIRELLKLFENTKVQIPKGGVPLRNIMVINNLKYYPRGNLLKRLEDKNNCGI